MERQKHQKVDLDEIKHLTVEYDYISKKEAEYLLEAKLSDEMDSGIGTIKDYSSYIGIRNGVLERHPKKPR